MDGLEVPIGHARGTVGSKNERQDGIAEIYNLIFFLILTHL